MASGHSSSAMPNTSTRSLSRRNDPPRNKALLAEIFALDQPNASGIEQMRAPAASRQRDRASGPAKPGLAVCGAITLETRQRQPELVSNLRGIGHTRSFPPSLAKLM